MGSLPLSAHLPMAHTLDPNERVPDPYRLFFPLGVAAGLVGVAIWPFYAAGWISSIPGIWHIDLQLQGFLFAFVLGFLMTALPRFSLTAHATWKEIGASLACFVAGNISTAFRQYLPGRILFLLGYLLLLTFAIRRARKRRSNPPEEFAFVAAALLVGLIAACLRVATLLVPMAGTYELLARRLMTEGMMLLLVLGIAGKLAPLFWGFAGFTSGPVPIGAVTPARKARLYLAAAATIALSFFLEYGGLQAAGLWLRAIVSSLVFFGLMKIHRKPERKGVLVTMLRISTWMVALAPWGAAFHPLYRVETLHIMFIGGFGVMILCIATRVILSHGNHPTDLEERSAVLAGGGALLLLAMVARALAPLFPLYYFGFLGVAGACWLAGLLLWGVPFTRRATIPGTPYRSPD